MRTFIDSDADHTGGLGNEQAEDSRRISEIVKLRNGWKFVCRLNLWRMELFKYMRVCQGVARCGRHRFRDSSGRIRLDVHAWQKLKYKKVTGKEKKGMTRC